MSKQGYFSCRDLIELPSMEGCELLAGASGLDNRVLRVSVSDNRDLLRWTEPGDVLITAGFLFRNDFSGLAEQIFQLRERGAAALCLKVQSSSGELPPEVLRQAEDLGFPVIRLPLNCIFSNVSMAVSEAIFNQETESFQQVQNRIERFLDAVNDNLGIEHTLQTLEELLHNAVILLDDNGEMLTTPVTGEYFRDLPSDPAQYLRKCAAQNSPIIELGGVSYPLSIFPINTGGTQPSLIVLCGISGPITEMDNTSISRISRILAVELRNSSTISKIQRKYKNQFVQDWLLGNFKTEADIHLAADDFGHTLPRGKAYQVAIARLQDSLLDEARMEEYISSVRRVIKNMDQPILFTFLSGDLILILEDAISPDNIPPYIVALLHRLEGMLHTESLSLCISSVQSAPGVPAAYEEAKKLLFISQQCGIHQPFIFREKLGIYSLLALLPGDSPDVASFRDHYLTPLLEYDRQHHSELTRTLQVYLAANHNTRATANRMFAHYNTIAYRINRIKEILQLDIDDVDISVELNIAFKLDTMRPKS